MGFLSDVKTDQRPVPEDNVAQVRSRARRRLIGAAALLAVGVIGFPLLFETKPRPVATDVPVVQSSRDRSATPGQTKVVERPAATAVAATPTPSNATTAPTTGAAAAAQTAAIGTTPSPMITERAQDAGREIPIPAPAADTARLAQEKAERERLDKERAAKAKADKDKADKDKADKDKAEQLAAEKAREDKAKAEKERQDKERASRAEADETRRVKADEQRRAKAGEERRARTAAQAKVASATKTAASDSGRFAVQVGAYASASSVRDVRNRLERVGLRSYTQVVKVGTRVRTGPYDSRQEAEKAADKARSIGLAPSIVPLSP